jgi:hypothetical protein
MGWCTWKSQFLASPCSICLKSDDIAERITNVTSTKNTTKSWSFFIVFIINIIINNNNNIMYTTIH